MSSSREPTRIYQLAPNLYAKSRRAWEFWRSLAQHERERYMRVAAPAGPNADGSEPADRPSPEA
jgi:hypothetical protein